MTTFGQVEWESAGTTSSDKKPGADIYLKLNNGSNELRIVTKPQQYIVHTYKKDPTNPKDFGQKIKCSAIHRNMCSL